MEGIRDSVSSRYAPTLPVQLTSFVGGRRRVAEVQRLLSSSRLVTLTGAGGVGKTRLALQVASRLQRTFRDGVWLVELAMLRDGELLVQTVAAELGVVDQPRRSLLESLIDYLADKRLLLVLDNCEHLSASCAVFVNRLLAATPRLRILATSREPLSIQGELVWPVPPLSLPGAEEPTDRSGRHEAVSLFAERAAAVYPGFTVTRDNMSVVAELCRRLDGLPLAIELAAVWLRTLSVEQIVARLNDRYRLLTVGHRAAPERHQTLRAAVKWSFDLCSELERTLWARLSVFAGEFDLEAAEAVGAGAGLPASKVFTGVAGLLDKSILIRGEGGDRARYKMLETIRQYGSERLAETGEEKRARHRHRDYMVGLARQVEREWFGPGQLESYARLHESHADLRAAFETCLDEPGQASTVHMTVVGIRDYWVWFGRLGEARRWLDRALAQDHSTTLDRASALWSAARLAVLQVDIPAARSLHHDCVAVTAQLGDPGMLARVTEASGLISFFDGDHRRAVERLEEALERLGAAGEESSGRYIVTLYELAWFLAVLGEVDSAIDHAEKVRRMSHERGAGVYLHLASWLLGFLQYRRGDLGHSAALVIESLRFQRLVHRVSRTAGWPAVPCIETLAWIGTAEGRYGRAAVMLGAAHALWRTTTTSISNVQPVAAYHETCEAQLRAALGNKDFTAAFSRGMRLSLDQAIAYALDEDLDEDHEGAPARRTKPSPLTRRETQVAQLVAQGLTNRQIAAKLVIADRTAENHVEKILVKLGFTSRAQIASWVTQQSTGDDDGGR